MALSEAKPLSFSTANSLSLAAAKPLQPNELSQSYTPATDDESMQKQSASPVQPEPQQESVVNISNESKKKEDNHIKVICRFRPKNNKEVAEEKRQNLSSTQEITVYNEGTSLEVPRKTRNKPKMNFTVDHVIWHTKSQEDTFNDLAKPTVNSVIEGYNCTIFAFGQTGSGVCCRCCCCYICYIL